MKSVKELLDLGGKSAVVTGGAMGIGLGIAARLAEAGASVVIADVSEEAGERAAGELAGRGLKALFVKCDVSNEDDVKRVVSAATENYGGLDILVNNAGIYPVKPVMHMEPQEFEKILAVNLKSVFLFTRAVATEMMKRGGGKIINITSIDALHPSSVGLAAYDASKHGLWGFTKNSALELAPHNIQVNAIAPGGINTPGTGSGAPRTEELEKILTKFTERIPMRRMGEADDIGKVALFLASDMSSYMTGSQVVVDGGVLLT